MGLLKTTSIIQNESSLFSNLQSILLVKENYFTTKNFDSKSSKWSTPLKYSCQSLDDGHDKRRHKQDLEIHISGNNGMQDIKSF